MDRCLSCMKEYNNDTARGKGNTCPFCGYEKGTPSEEIYHLNPGTILRDRYVLGVVIGFGGFGITYKAWDKNLETVVAVKEYYPTSLVQRIVGENKVSIYAQSRKKEFYAGMTRFMSEAKNMARFAEVPNIVHVNNYFEENNTAYIVMEYLDGITLNQLLEDKGKLTGQETLEIMFPVMNALHALHSENILHRDVSPDNIFICNDGQIKLIDFGAARFSDVDNEMTRSIILKAGYAPVEQYRAKSMQGPFTDIYAVGATIYRCVTGEVPEESVSRALEDKLKAPAEIDETIPKYISEAVMKSMALSPEIRFASLPQFKKALEKKKVVKGAKREIKARKIRRAIIVFVFIVIIVVGGVGAYQFYRYKSSKIVLEKSTVTIWVPAQVSEETMEEDLSAKEKEISVMAEKFLQDQENVSIEVTAIPEAEYYDKLEEAAASGNLPTLFISDKASDEVLENTVVWDDVYEYLDVSNCYFLEEYKEEISAGKQFPTAFDAPVVYVRRTNGIDINSVELSQFNQLDTDGSKGYYIESDSYAMFINSLGGQFYYGTENALDDNALFMLQNVKEEFESKEYQYDEDDTEQDIVFDSFEDGSITYYLASVKDYDAVRQELPGLYAFRPVVTEQICGEFSRMWSIGECANENEIIAVKVLMNYMLAERPQKTLFVSENVIPLNKSVFDTMSDIDENYAVLDSYTDKMIFDYGKQFFLDAKETEFYKDIILGEESIENWSNRQ